MSGDPSSRLQGNATPNSFASMTPTAERILSDFDALDPQEELMVRARVLAAAEPDRRDPIVRLRGSAGGERLLERLLSDRAEDRARG